MSKNILEWKVGTQHIIETLEGNPVIVERLRELGFSSGEVVSVIHKAPFGDPVVVQIRDTSIALRKLELQCIRIK